MTHLLINIVAFIVAIGILVTFHECGHFWMARWLGVRVLQFSVGFGKPLLKFKKDHTQYVIAALPIGGYVKMLDEREGEVSEADKPFAFNRQPLWARFLIVLAGPLANFVFAILAYWVVYMVGITGVVPIVGEVAPHSIAAEAGLLPGEEIVSIDGVNTRTWSQVYKQLMGRIGSEGSLEIKTQSDNRIKSYQLAISKWELKSDRPDLLHSLGITGFHPPIPPIIEDVKELEPAAQAGVQAGDVITAVNGKPITDWKGFSDVVTRSINIPVRLTIDRQGQTVDIVFKPRARETDTGEVVGFAGLVAKHVEMPKELLRLERLNPLAAFVAGVQKTGEFIHLTFRIIGKMVTGELGLKTISGPISIAQGAGESVTVGLQYYLGFLALISISLGVLNLLPIPILDGGHLLYYVIELIMGKPVPDKIQLIGFQIGVALLIILMTIAFYNDIMRLL
jgi:regulator of sigma E protease